jgi:anti-anti-sigma factor
MVARTTGARLSSFESRPIRVATRIFKGGVVVIDVEGEINDCTRQTLREAMIRELEGGNTRVVLNLASASFWDNDALYSIFGPVKRFREGGGDVILLSPRPEDRARLARTSFDRIIRVFDDEGEALGHLTGFAPTSPERSGR